MLTAYFRARAAPGGDALVRRGLDIVVPAVLDVLTEVDDEFIADLEAIISSLVYGLVGRFAAGEIAITDILPSLDRTVFWLTSGRHPAGGNVTWAPAPCCECLTMPWCPGVAARIARRAVVWWEPMSSAAPRIPHATAVAAACAALLVIGSASAAAEPAADNQGFVDSTARCTTPDVAVAFGATATSRVAICKTPAGQYQYRGVRVSDGAKLILPASASGDGGFVADNDGITYTITAKSLAVSAGSRVLRDEPMLYFRGPEPATSPPPATPTPSTPLPPPLPAEVGGSGR